MKKYTIKVKYLVPIRGFGKFLDENPAPNGENIHENRKYALRALPLAMYHLACTLGMATAVGIGIHKGLEVLIN